MLLEPFSLQFDSKKITAKLYKELEHIVLEELYADYTDLQGTLLTFMDKLLLKVPYPVVVEDMVEAKELFKLMKCRIDYGCTTLSEALCGYVTLLAQLCGVKVLFLVDCEKYLTDDERQALQQTANYQLENLVISVWSQTVTARFNEEEALENLVISVWSQTRVRDQ